MSCRCPGFRVGLERLVWENRKRTTRYQRSHQRFFTFAVPGNNHPIPTSISAKPIQPLSLTLRNRGLPSTGVSEAYHVFHSAFGWREAVMKFSVFPVVQRYLVNCRTAVRRRKVIRVSFLEEAKSKNVKRRRHCRAIITCISTAGRCNREVTCMQGSILCRNLVLFGGWRSKKLVSSLSRH